MTRARTTAILAIVVVLLVGLVVYAAYATRDSWSEPVPVDAPAPAGLAGYYDQDLSWSSCGDAHCTWVTVPIDYALPSGPTTRLRVKLHPAMGDGGRALFVNPGGPGGSAVDFSDAMATQFGSSVRDAYDIVGVDPRGVGRSDPLTCLPDKEFDSFVTTDPDPDDPAEVTALRSSITALGDACRDNSGALAAHVSTVEVARDMDVVRALLGQRKLDWFGTSYGTLLGAAYADLFPRTVGRMVLDGAVDPSQDAIEGSFAQTTGFQRAVESYAAECATNASCPIGSDPAAGVQRIADLLHRLDATPLPGLEDRKLTEGAAFYGIAVTLYDQQSWPVLTQALKAALQGDGSILLRLSDIYFQREADGSYVGNGGQVIYAVNCLDARDRPDAATVEAQLPRFEKASPVFGSSLAWGALACTDWPIKATNPLPTIDAKGAPPIVVIGTTRDPATPYESARALAGQLASAVLVTRVGDGHTAYASGNACIRTAVDDFLAAGTVPRKGLTCR